MRLLITPVLLIPAVAVDEGGSISEKQLRAVAPPMAGELIMGDCWVAKAATPVSLRRLSSPRRCDERPRYCFLVRRLRTHSFTLWLARLGSGSAISLTQAEQLAIWGQPSADVARRAVYGGMPVQGNLVTPAGANTVQTLRRKASSSACWLGHGGTTSRCWRSQYLRRLPGPSGRELYPCNARYRRWHPAGRRRCYVGGRRLSCVGSPHVRRVEKCRLLAP